MSRTNGNCVYMTRPPGKMWEEQASEELSSFGAPGSLCCLDIKIHFYKIEWRYSTGITWKAILPAQWCCDVYQLR